MALLKVQGTKMVRDTTNGALINQDKSGLDDYIKRRNMAAAQKDEINKIKEEVQEVRVELSEIKHLIIKLIEGRNV